MPTEGMSPKTFAVRQFSRYIPAGSIRVAAEPAYDPVLASAYINPVATGLTVVLINPGAAEEPVALTLKGLQGVTSLDQHRTSASENGRALDAVPVDGGRATLSLPSRSIVTLTTVR